VWLVAAVAVAVAVAVVVVVVVVVVVAAVLGLTCIKTSCQTPQAYSQFPLQ